MFRFALVAFLATMLAGCVSPQERAQSKAQRWAEEMPAVQPSEKERRYAVALGYPVISTSTKDASRTVVIYLTPSCPVCMRLYTELVAKNVLTSTALEDAVVTFVFVPRVDQDHRLLKNIFCVAPENAFQEISDYYAAATADAIQQLVTADADEMRALTARLGPISEQVARKYGATTETLAACQENRVFDGVIRAAWEKAWKRNNMGEWPLAVVDGNARVVTRSADLLEML